MFVCVLICWHTYFIDTLYFAICTYARIIFTGNFNTHIKTVRVINYPCQTDTAVEYININFH